MVEINIKEVIRINIDRYSLKEIENIIEKEYQKINNQLNANDHVYIERKYIKYCLDYWIDEISDSLSKHVEIGNEVIYKKFIDVNNIKHFNEILSPFNESKYYKLLMKHYDLLMQHNEEALLRRFKNKCLELLFIHIDIVLREIDFLIALVEFLDMYEKSERHSDMTELQYLSQYADISNDEFFKTVKNLMGFNVTDHDLKLKRLQTTAQLLMGAKYVTLIEKYKEIIGAYFKPITITKLMINNRAVIEIKGGNFRLSDKQIKGPITLLLLNNPNIEEVRFICSGIIYVDADFKNNVWHGKNIVMYAKAIRVCDTITWDVSGKSATSLIPCKADTAEDGNGINGKCGECGESGGNVFIHADNIFQPQRLLIKSNGGDGSDGQSGGDGKDGSAGTGVSYLGLKNMFPNCSLLTATDNIQIILHTIISSGKIHISWLDGKHLSINTLINISSKCEIFQDIYVEAEAEEGRRIYFSSSKCNENLLLYKGSLGQPGGRGGMGGLGGQGGHAGKIIGCSDIIITANVGRNGKNGATGKHGNHGRNGWDMAYISYNWNEPIYYGIDKNKVLELNYYDDDESDSERIYIPYRKYINSEHVYAKISSHPIPKPNSTFIEKEELSMQAKCRVQVMTKQNILPDRIFAHYSQHLIKIDIDLYQNFHVQMENLGKQILEKMMNKMQQVQENLQTNITRMKPSYQHTNDVHSMSLRSCLNEWAFWLSTNNKYVMYSPNEQDKQKYEQSLDKLIKRIIKCVQHSFKMSDQDSQGASTPTEIAKDKREPSNLKVKNKCDKGSQLQQAEKTGTKKNKELQMDNFKILPRYTSTELFGDRQLNPAVRPQIEIPIGTEIISDACDLAADILHGACMVPPALDDEFTIVDAEVLKWVTALQIESKMYHARSGTEFIPELGCEVAQRVKRTDLLLNESLVPLAVIVDQVGRFSINDQVFIPVFNNVSDFSYGRLQVEDNNARRLFTSLRSSTPNVSIIAGTEFRNVQGRQMYARIIKEDAVQLAVDAGILVDVNGSPKFSEMFLQDPAQYPWIGLVEFVPKLIQSPAVPTFEKIVALYADLKGRVSEKLNNAFDSLDLNSGQGKESQLVYTSTINQTDMLEVWSPRWLEQKSLEMGAIFRLGYSCLDNSIGHRNAAACKTVIDRADGLETFITNVLTKKIH